jgi:mono/diheme cytochrome c family protein
MLKTFFFILAALGILVVGIAGFRGEKFGKPPLEIFSDMVRQPRYNAQAPCEFFADGCSARPPVANTVPLGYAMPQHKPVNGSSGADTSPYKQVQFPSGDSYFDTGKIGPKWGTGIPLEEITPALLARGQQQFTTFCQVCHGATGAGNGIAGQYGLAAIANLHQQRLQVMADGEIFHTISYGKNTMLGYGDRIPVPDRWAIVAFLRALQKSQGGAAFESVPPEEQSRLEAQPQ